MIKTLIKHKVIEFCINNAFDSIIKHFNLNVMKLTYDQITDDMVGKMVVFVESENGYDYELPAAIEKNPLFGTSAVYSNRIMKYTLKGKRRFRPEGKHEPNMSIHYKHKNRFADQETNEYMYKNMVFHVLMD